jgi:hypothetical protein
MTDTDLLELVKSKTCALSISFSNSGLIMAMYCRDRKIRLFSVRTGRLIHTYDETL